MLVWSPVGAAVYGRIPAVWIMAAETTMELDLQHQTSRQVR